MINKMVTREINNLKDKIKELEIENKRLKQVLGLRNNEVEELERNLRITKKVINNWGIEFREDNGKLKEELTYWKETSNYWKETTFELESNNKELKAKITYWKETAENWKNLYKEADSGLQYLKSYSSNLEKALNNSIKSVDK